MDIPVLFGTVCQIYCADKILTQPGVMYQPNVLHIVQDTING